MKANTILVTGAAGFIGSSMCDRLLKDGHNVIGVDNLSVGNQHNLPTHKRFKFYKLDISNGPAVNLIFQENKIDVVMHFAGNASIVNAMTNPTLDVQNNIITTMNIVNACVEYEVTRLLHASTMVVYGADNVNKKETDACVPTSTYGLTKYAGERYVMNAGARNDLQIPLNVTAFRMFNVYGPKQDLNNPYQGVVAIFIGNTLRKVDTIIHGDGKQTRDFVYIDDVLDAWISSIENKKTFGQVFNLGSGKDLSINYILEQVTKEMNMNFVFPSAVNRFPARQGDIQKCVSNSSKLIKTIGWKPKVSFEAGLNKFVNCVKGK